jgi:hypothetical protein
MGKSRMPPTPINFELISINKMKNKDDFLKYYQEFWSKKYGRELTVEETKETNNNLVGFFKKLSEFDRNQNEHKE